MLCKYYQPQDNWRGTRALQKVTVHTHTLPSLLLSALKPSHLFVWTNNNTTGMLGIQGMQEHIQV